MAWTTPKTYTVGEVLTAATMNTHVRDNLNAVRDLIGSHVLSGANATLTVSSIGTGYNALLLSVYARADAAATAVAVLLRFNNDAGAVYDSQYLTAAAATVGGAESIGATGIRVGQVPAASATANRFGAIESHVPLYAGTVDHKAATARAINPSGTTSGSIILETGGGVWRSAVAINRIDLVPTSGNFIAGSRLDVYGMQG